MKEDIAKKWVSALRSGDYKQNTGNLGRKDSFGNDQFCCLGVLCELMGKDSDKLRREIHGGKYQYNGYGGKLPDAARNWSGIKTGGGEVSYNDKTTTLALLNDNGKTFEEIADIIEKQYKEL